MCGVIGHFKVKYPRVRQRGSGDFGSRAEKVAKKLLVRKEILGVTEVAVEEDVVVECGKKHFVANKNHSDEPTRPVQRIVPSLHFLWTLSWP